MPKYLLIDSVTVHIPGHGYPAHTETYPKLKWFDSDEELLSFLDTWGRDIQDPLIYELGKRGRVERKMSISLTE